MMKPLAVAITVSLALLVVGVAGCVSTEGSSGVRFRVVSKPGGKDDHYGAKYLALNIKQQLRHPEVINQPIVVTTFVDLNNLAESSVFGRILAERVLNELHKAGFTVSEIRKGRDIFIREELGELILTRDAKEALSRLNARAILAGTYVVTVHGVAVNARLIDINSPLILSSSAYDLKMTDELKKLLTGESPF